MKSGQRAFAFFIFLFLTAAFSISGVHAQAYDLNFSTSSSSSSQPNAQLLVQELNYQPYPASAGNWIDLWVKVENIGAQDAPHVRFELLPGYPFSSSDELARDYGTLSGTTNANLQQTTGQSNLIILRYRVKIADDAPEGISNLNLKMSTGENPSDNSSGVIVNLPISIGRTKTDFDVVMQSANAQGTSFSLANIGENPASAVTVSIEPQQGIGVSGAQSSIIGNLAPGDFTTVSYQVIDKSANNITASRRGYFSNGGARAMNSGNFTRQSPTSIKIKIDYTDITGTRQSIEKDVPVDLSGLSQPSSLGRASSAGTTPPMLYILVGAAAGAAIVYLIFRRKQGKSSVHAHVRE